MFQQLIGFVFRKSHFWRQVSFDEIAELYVSRLLTVFAQNAVNLFAAVYLYKLGYSVTFIALYYGCLYVLKLPFAIIAGKVTAYFGPKHSILIGNLLRIPSLAAFAFVEQFGLVAVAVFGLFQAMAVVFYNIGYAVDFSKVKNPEHAGKEIGTMQIVEKIARVISPLAGGLLATMVSAEAAIILACALFTMAAWPLMKTVEPTILRTKLRFGDFPWATSWQIMSGQIAAGIDFIISGVVWTLFVTTIIFAAQGETIYAILGALASLGVLASMVTSWTFGKLIDKRRTSLLVVVGAITNTIIHIFRPFASTPAGVVGTNIASETATSAYSMSFLRVNFDAADASGHRIAFMTLSEIALNIGAAVACFVWAFTASKTNVTEAYNLMFVFGAVGVLLLIPARHYASMRRPRILKSLVSSREDT